MVAQRVKGVNAVFELDLIPVLVAVRSSSSSLEKAHSPQQVNVGGLLRVHFSGPNRSNLGCGGSNTTTGQ
jgi:hypothetical protein